MKIRYITNARIPTPRAHGLQIMKTCEALARAGAEVELVVPRRPGTDPADPFSYYLVEPLFRIVYLPTIEFSWRGRSYGFVLQTLAFTFSVARYLKQHPDDAVVYIRGEAASILPLLMRRVRFFWENHIKARRPRFEARAVRHAQGIIVVTKRYRDDLMNAYHLSPDAVLVAPDGVDIDQFDILVGKEEARRKLCLPLDKKLVLYTGSDLPWKGLDTLRRAAVLLPDEYETVFVGPIVPKGDTSRQRFIGQRPYAEMPLWLAAADALVLTGDSASETARFYTSPMKLFEYMSARRPIVVTDLPSFRDVLTEKEAKLVVPGDPQALADGVVQAVSDPGARVGAAFKAAQQYGWSTRARMILEFVRARQTV